MVFKPEENRQSNEGGKFEDGASQDDNEYWWTEKANHYESEVLFEMWAELLEMLAAGNSFLEVSLELITVALVFVEEVGLEKNGAHDE